jgi:monofunctional biosynthetic peptidoglycan transglycosylase
MFIKKDRSLFLNFSSLGIKITLPMISLALFLSPLVYYVCLLLFSGIYWNHSRYFYIKDEKPIFVDKPPASWTPLNSVPRKAVWPMVLSEDWAFYQHNGIDWNQLAKVLNEGLKNFQFSRGASTITQQVVKNLFLSKERSFFRKINEVILTYYLEEHTSKRWILEQYINLIELDRNVYGIRQGAKHYFSKKPSQLNPREGAFLALLLPNPKAYSISYRKRGLTRFARRQLSQILAKMVIAGHLSREEMNSYLGQSFSWEMNAVAPSANEVDQLFSEIRAQVQPITPEVETEVSDGVVVTPTPTTEPFPTANVEATAATPAAESL